jgi:hypothetical protein
MCVGHSTTKINIGKRLTLFPFQATQRGGATDQPAYRAIQRGGATDQPACWETQQDNNRLSGKHLYWREEPTQYYQATVARWDRSWPSHVQTVEAVSKGLYQARCWIRIPAD